MKIFQTKVDGKDIGDLTATELDYSIKNMRKDMTIEIKRLG